ncbi:MAG: S9 family peptidase [Chloroflexota bacterium]|nr:S9 family peptidase [Chloroflexota bacterium]MDE2948636.1 S9 family peptidase [Chloroflexota bacterium]
MTEPRCMQKEDLFELRFLNGGALSPDGLRVVYCVNKIDSQKDKEFSTIYRLDIASGEARQMTNGLARDSQPIWSPDGKSIAFISDRDGRAQLHLLPADGGEARQMTRFKRGIGASIAWSPDGSRVAFCAVKDADAPDLRREPYRLDRTVYRFDGIGYLDDAVQDIYALHVTSGAIKQLTDDRSHNSNPRWAPDGQSILYDANMRDDATRAMTPELMTVDLKGNQRKLAAGWASLAGASFTPDGERIVFIGRPDDGKPIGTKSDLYELDIASGDLSCRTRNLDVGVGGRLSMDMPVGGLSEQNLLVSDDGDFAFASVQRGGTDHIYRVALNGAEDCQPVTQGDCAVFPLDRRGGRLLYAQTSLNTPPELFLRDMASGASTRLTALNDDLLGAIALPETERLSWESIDGVLVEGWYMKPAIGAPPYPTILYIHGGPHAAYGYGFHFDFQMLAGAGYGVLFLNHRASTGYGDGFSTAIKGDWGNLDYQDLMSGVDHAIALGLADGERLGVCGTSGGGNLSCWIIGQTDRFKAAIPQNPVTNWRSFYGTSDIGIWFAVEQMGGHPHEILETYERCSPITYAHRCTTPTLMVQSEIDWRCPAEQSEQFYTVLKANGCVVEMLRQPAGFHGASISGAVNLRRAHNDAMLDWFATYVLSA